MKKGLTSLVALSLSVVALAGCNNNSSKMKVGLICVEGENSTYDKNFIDGFKAAADKAGVEAVIKTDIPEGDKAYQAAADLADNGCKFVFRS